MAVAEEQSFTKAAAKLAVTTTAVSKMIKNLESRLGQQLLERHTRKVVVTDIGQRFYLHCKRLAQEMSATENFLQAQHEVPQGRLRILSGLSFAKYYLNKHLYEFHQKYPLIQLEIEVADRIPDLERENFDIVAGFKMWPHIDPQLRFRKIIPTRYILCASEKYLNQYGIPQTPQDLKNHKLINHPLRHPINLVRFADGTEVYMNSPEIVVNNMEMLTNLVIQGAGIIWVCEIEVIELLKEKKLIHLLPDYPMEKIHSHIFYRYSEYEQTKVRSFIDFFAEKLEQ